MAGAIGGGGGIPGAGIPVGGGQPVTQTVPTGDVQLPQGGLQPPTIDAPPPPAATFESGGTAQLGNGQGRSVLPNETSFQPTSTGRDSIDSFNDENFNMSSLNKDVFKADVTARKEHIDGLRTRFEGVAKLRDAISTQVSGVRAEVSRLRSGEPSDDQLARADKLEGQLKTQLEPLLEQRKADCEGIRKEIGTEVAKLEDVQEKFKKESEKDAKAQDAKAERQEKNKEAKDSAGKGQTAQQPQSTSAAIAKEGLNIMNKVLDSGFMAEISALVAAGEGSSIEAKAGAGRS